MDREKGLNGFSAVKKFKSMLALETYFALSFRLTSLVPAGREKKCWLSETPTAFLVTHLLVADIYIHNEYRHLGFFSTSCGLRFTYTAGELNE